MMAAFSVLNTKKSLLATALGLCALPAIAADLHKEAKFEIAAQSLLPALYEFSTQAKVQIVTKAAEISGAVTHGVNGKKSLNGALDELLQGTPFSFEIMDDSTIAIISRPTADTAASGSGLSDSWNRFLLVQADSASSTYAANDEAKNGQSEQGGKREIEALEEVVVTAQKREERLQDVPISISVLGGDALDKSTVTGITDALRRVPGVVAIEGVQGGGTKLAVRGVTAYANLAAGSSPIAYYVDGVPFGLTRSAVAPDPGVYDLERVEVLRGPQGTLYGANAMNGVVRVLTHEADLDEFEFKARASSSNTEDGDLSYGGDAAINIPIIEGKLAARAVLGYQNLSGWIDAPNKNDVNDAQLRNVRLKLNAQPTEALSIGISAWLARNDYGAPSQSDDDRNIAVSLDQPITTDYDTYGLTIGYDLPLFSVKSVTSYLDYRNKGFLDLNFLAPNFVLPTAVESAVFTQELYLASTDKGSWRWTLGGMYREGDDSWKQYPTFGDFDDRSESYAIFGELTRRFLDGRLELTGGLRYFEDDVSLRETIPFDHDLTRPLIRADETFDALTPRVILTWHAGADLTWYGSYSEGFRSGTTQGPSVYFIAPDLPVPGPDTLKNYEVGAKGSLLERRLDFEAAVFYIDWQDVQMSLSIPYRGVTAPALVNAESASGIGFEAAVTARPVEGFTLGASFNWNDLTVDSDVISDGVVLFGKGDRLNVSPEYTVGAFADYTFPLGTGGIEGRFSTSANYHSPLDVPAVISGAVVVLRGDPILVARTGFSIDAPKRWSATLFVDNLADEKGKVVRQGQLTPFWHTYVRPRTIGVQVDYAF